MKDSNLKDIPLEENPVKGFHHEPIGESSTEEEGCFAVTCGIAPPDIIEAVLCHPSRSFAHNQRSDTGFRQSFYIDFYRGILD